ncbi:MAG: YaiI/YqxD family protein [Planctomycetes bacterium]|nr:YaiI/YqxD family protein [Planctomycetota bacterium]
MKIWIDADAAPRDVKELVFRASKRLSIEVMLVANQSIWFPQGSRLIQAVTVRNGANIADQYIVEHAAVGDVVITADVPLAAQLVANQVFVLDPRGEVYDDRNVGARLASRDFLDAARGAGMELSGPSPYSQRDRTEFASALDRTLTRAIKLRDRPT